MADIAMHFYDADHRLAAVKWHFAFRRRATDTIDFEQRMFVLTACQN
jgi:hypothetical protein